jgi:hypothetical protein
VLKWRNSVSIIDKQGRFLVKFVDRNKQKPVPPPAVLDARAAADDEIDDLPGLYLGGGDVSPKAYKNRHITEIDVSKITKSVRIREILQFKISWLLIKKK